MKCLEKSNVGVLDQCKKSTTFQIISNTSCPCSSLKKLKYNKIDGCGLSRTNNIGGGGKKHKPNQFKPSRLRPLTLSYRVTKNKKNCKTSLLF
jgi:hypothetical protein